ncbi:hypothetical protein AA103196_2045 [Ameyamaea chiangmaiensis NBRC 103196]|uniref:Rap1a immunity protein domain-containing protein n=1 Tax=Ameyamaea chiangmaiensis TaxID=442969 RepID=A0A850P7R0_9PROT|nr:Rap1a/Tai family immunity protein [Ameyamaea chiangmaiensis]MBS4073689.1 hypothetical protein [Ameyamaea chiangmaiensis]NVN39043.1 hypothetical protein [Ameyamaea chiangmaiensis]GBQ68804.1 hypothetical protein AA103196_2045 [Ameyamaea chiangmaiensis NBRC 103196]
MKRIVLALALTACAATPALAQRVSPLTAGKFVQICSRQAGAQICDAYISGIADAGALSKVSAKNEGDAGAIAGFCIPNATTGAEMRAKVVTWLRGHDSVLGAPVGEGVFAALHDAWPCGAAK